MHFSIVGGIITNMHEISNWPFFVYGTLLPGQPNAFLWVDGVLSQDQAVLPNGRLYDLGHYPMLIEEGDSPVQGMVLTIQPNMVAEIMARLDHLEGYDPEQHEACAYQRVAREVWLADGRSLTAWVYIGQPHYVAGLPAVDGGDWANYVTTMEKQSGEWWVNVRTVSGLLD